MKLHYQTWSAMRNPSNRDEVTGFEIYSGVSKAEAMKAARSHGGEVYVTESRIIHSTVADRIV